MGLFGKKDSEKFDESKYSSCIGEYSKWGENKEPSHNIYTIKDVNSITSLLFFKVKSIKMSGPATFPYWPTASLDFELAISDIDHVDFEYKPGMYMIYTKSGKNYAAHVPADLFESIKKYLESLW